MWILQCPILDVSDHTYNVLTEFFLQKISGFYKPPPLPRIPEKMGGDFSYLDVEEKTKRVTAPQNTTRNFTATLKLMKKKLTKN